MRRKLHRRTWLATAGGGALVLLVLAAPLGVALQVGGPWIAGVALLAAALGSAWLTRVLAWGVAARRAGYAAAFSEREWHVCVWPGIAWSDVACAELRRASLDQFGWQHELLLTLSTTARAPAWWRRQLGCHGWAALRSGRDAVGRPQLRLSLAWLDTTPEAVLAVARQRLQAARTR